MTRRIALPFLPAALALVLSCSSPEPPAAVGPLPSQRQLAWHDLQYYAFVHFNMNTFTNREWGTGGETPAQFNPTQLDARQWARVARDAGMKGIILTAKHHDGFCLWPTQTTTHSVKHSPWRNGQGDLVAEVAEACREYGLKFGIYLSPWDRNNAAYGSPEYVKIFHEQLRELLTGYGPLFEVWFDGANGGSGYYGGANETRKIDNRTYYQWDTTTALVRRYQPDAVIFSDGGPDIRWVGTEEGWAGETNWSIMRRDEIYPGWERYEELRYGHEDGTHWLPAEVNTSIRPGWYYHPGEDHQVKSLARLVRTYYESIGRNGNFLLNLPVDQRGLVHETDAAHLLALKKQIDQDFARELARNTRASASNVRGRAARFSADKAIDGDPDTYWATDDGRHAGTLTLTFLEPTEVNRLVLQEYIPLGQRVRKFTVEAQADGRWVTLDTQTTIGYKRILRFDPVKASAVRLNILDAKGPVALSNLELYRAPNLLTEPVMARDREGRVSLSVADPRVAIFYTLDGSMPGANSQAYDGPIPVEVPTAVRAIALDPESGQQTAVVGRHFDIPKKGWLLVSASSGDVSKAGNLMDEDPETLWATGPEAGGTPEVTLDLGAAYRLSGFTYWPSQERYPTGIITSYEFLTSPDGRTWSLAATGEFGNIANNRIEQVVRFEPVQARYIRMKALKAEGEGKNASFAELGVITEGN